MRKLSMVTVLAGLVACGKQYYPLSTPRRPEAVANKDWEAAVAMDRDVLAVRHQLTPAQQADLDAAFASDFRAYLQSLVDAIGPLTAQSARAQVSMLLGLRAFLKTEVPEQAEAFDQEYVAARLTAALDLLWATEGEGADSDWTRVAVAWGLALKLPESRFVALAAELKQKVIDTHLALAQAAGTQYPGAQYLHAQLAHYAGGPAAGELPEAVRAATAFPRSYEVTGPACSLSSLRSTTSATTGHPMKVVIDVQNCVVGIENLPTIVSDRPYTEKEEVKVPIETWSSGCHTEYGSPTMVNTQDKYGNRGTGFTRSSSEVCDTPEKGFHGEYETVEQDVEKVEQVTIESRRHVAAANGYYSITFDTGEVVTGSFELRDTSTQDEQYSSVHSGSKRFDDATHRKEAEDALENGVRAAISESARPVLFTYAKEFFARGTAAAEAGNAAEAEHNFLLGALITGDYAPLDTVAEAQHHLPKYTLFSMRGNDPPKAVGLDVDSIVIRGSAVSERDAYIRREVREDSDDSGIADHIVFSLTGGYVSASETASGGRSSSGAVAQAGISSLIKIPESSFVAGVVVRGALGKAGPGLVEADMNLAGGFGIGHFSIAALIGGGTDRTMGYDVAMPDADNFELPPAGFSQYGLRADYLFEVIPLHIETIYTKAFRGSDTSVDVAKRLELRAGLRDYKPVGVIVRYSEYDETNADSFFSSFGGSSRVGKSLWILGGLVY